MSLRRVSPAEAQQLVDGKGYVYVDVRSVPEFEAGHPTGAYNVPLMHKGPLGVQPNPDFMPVMEKTFPRDAALVVGCQSGGRSLRAASVLQQAGYTNVDDQRAGFDGIPGEPGWRPAGLPVSTNPTPGRAWDELKER